MLKASGRTITSRRDKVNYYLRGLFSLADDDRRTLINLLYARGVTQQAIANALGVSLRRIQQKYPKTKGGETT